MITRFTGNVWKYGDNINTDAIFPGKCTYQKMEPAEMAKLALEDLDPEFLNKVKDCDIWLARYWLASLAGKTLPTLFLQVKPSMPDVPW